MKRAAALILVVLMLIQFLPVQAETYSDWYQVETETPAVYDVRFLADGEEISVISVADGSRVGTVPDGPKKSGFVFVGWYVKGEVVTANTLVTGNMIAEAFYTEADEKVEENDAADLEDSVLYVNEDFYLTGKLPDNSVIDVQTAKVSIDGEKVLAAYEISINSADNQLRKSKARQQTDEKVQVHFHNDAFVGEINIYQLSDAKAEPKYITTIEAVDGWITFDAEPSGTYAMTQSIEQEVTIDGATYRITVTYDKKAGIPDGAALEVKTVGADNYLDAMASALDLGADDEIYYAKFLDISIVYDGVEIQPKTPVTVAVELLDVTDGAEALETVHFGDRGAEKVNSTVDSDGTVTFRTNSFSVYGFGSILRSLISWTADSVNYSIQGFSALLKPSYTAIDVLLEEGLEVVNAYNVHSALGGLLNALYVKVSTTLDLGSRESVVVYSVKDGAVADVLAEGQNVDESLSLGSADGFAVVRDTGYRRKVIDLGSVVLDGMLPKTAEAEAVETEADVDGEVLAAFNITIEENGVDYQPDSEHPVEVSIAVGKVSETADLHVWHILDDGSREEITEFTFADGKVQFTAEGFSVYTVVATTLTETVSASDGNTYEIEVTYQNTSGIPMEGTVLQVSELLPGNEAYEVYLAASAAKVNAAPESIELSRVFDIRIVDENDHNTVYEPTGDVTVSIRLVGETLNAYANLDVLHFIEDEDTKGFTIYDMKGIVDGETVEFTTGSFSVYAVIGTTYLRTYRFYSFNEFGEYVEYALYTDSGKTTFTQTIKNGEKPVAPQNPTNPQDPNATFAGWFEDIRESGATDPVFAAGAYDFDNIPEITQDEEVHLYAKFNSYAYVIFHDQYDADTCTFPVAYTVRKELTDGSASISTADYRVNYHGNGNGMVFTGWSEVPITTPGAANNDLDEAVEKLNDTITVTDNKDLYPIFTPVYWITFYSGYSGSGATYYPETYYLNGEGPNSLANYIPTRNVGDNGAYTFTGWYAGATLEGEEGKEEANITSAVKVSDADGILVQGFSDEEDLGISVQNGRIVLTKDVTLYAGWLTTGKAAYTVVVVKQRATDGSDIPDTDKTYEFAESFVLSGTIGNSVSAGEDYISLNTDASYNALHEGANVSDTSNPYYGYSYNTTNSTQSATILADGSAVLYVRYDWTTQPSNPTSQTFTLTFADSLDTESSSDLPVAYDGSDHNKVAWTTPLADYVPKDPTSGRSGYSFSGWYADKACTTRAFFSDDSAYQDYTGVKVLFATMPGADVTVYAGWQETKYKVNIDPNYGAMYAYDGNGNLTGTGATYFNGTYTSIIQEYTTVTRDYVESASGTWYYVKHDRAFYDAGNTVAGNDRYTYYTQDPSEATEFTTFAYEPGVYRYAGWYEVFNYGEADEYESDTPYVFGKPVDHETTLRLHWTKVGAFYLVYDPGVGTLNDNEDQETFYVDLDGDTYADNADVVITRIATPPDGYEFTGWTIRGDESGNVYYPGRSFTLLTQYAATVQGKKTVYLDAVYTKVPTASIVFDANGGTITENDLDYGRPYDPAAPTPVYSCDTAAGTAMISNLVNNSRVYLSDGSGFSRTDAIFIGWSNKQVYDPEDETAVLYLPGVQTTETYNVDTSESFVLYAVWQVSIVYHLNQENANFGGDWGTGYTPNTGETYTQNVYVGTSADRPPVDPVYTGSDGKMFRYWATKDASDNYIMYDFTRAVQDELHLYAYWDAPTSIVVHAVDATAETIVEKTSSDPDWTVTTPLSVSTSFDLSTSAPEGVVAVPSGYSYAFAAVYSSSANLQDISESNAVDSIYYSSEDGKIHAVYQNGRDTALSDEDEIYFIYYQQEKLNINYRTMADNGTLADATVSSSAPTDTVSTLGQYNMAAVITTPLSWQSGSSYYAFAIGNASATSAKDLTLITSTADSDTTRPALLVKNTWHGFAYSTDDGTTWTSCGYAPTLYVVYFAKQATVVTFMENTVGLAADMGTPFTFNYKIERVLLADNTVAETVYDTTASGNSPVQLRHGEAYSAILFTDTTSTQKVMITQTEQPGFTTAVSANGEPSATPYSFTAIGSGTAQSVVFTNTRTTAATVEVHVALVDVVNGKVTLSDNQRTDDSEKYRFDLAFDEEEIFSDKLSPNQLFIGDTNTYAFGTVLYGTDNDGTVTIDGMEAVSVSCELVDTEDANVYGVYLKDSNGNRLTELGDYTIYYLYYPMPVIRFMEEGDVGALTEIKGSTDGTTVSNTITYDGAALTLNGKTVEQNQKLEIPQNGLIISQSVGNEYFNMPPLIDKGIDKLYLVYSRIGTGAPNQENIADISVSDDLSLYLQIRDNKLEWSFDEKTWTAFTEMPTIYAIYRERGYTLEITKTVPIDTGYREPFTVVISSTAINRASYSVEGTGYSTVSAEQANGLAPGKITVEVEDGCDIKIFGLGSGNYTISESGNENHELTAEQKYSDKGSTVTENLDVTENSRVTIEFDREKTLALTNTPKVICKVGTRYFYTIQSAVQWIEDNSATFSGTIEMLVDYLMPSSDAPVIPYYLDVTLTTASEYGSGTATITRSGSFSSGAMFTNSGVLTLQNITLDGNKKAVTASSAMINNEGTLTIGSGAVLQNAACSGNGGAVNSWDGSVTVSGGTVSGNQAKQGGAIYASGGSVEVNGGSISSNSAQSGGAIYYYGNDAVNVTGGSISNNNAENGGAVYLEKGTLTMSGGSMSTNGANKNGGAIYAVNGEIEVSGGTIGGNGTGNEAQNGGAIYLESGSITVSGGSISHNEASHNGGGICTGTGTVTLSGGSLASNTATENGGGVYTASGAITVSGRNTAITSNSAANGGGLSSIGGAISVTSATLSGNIATSGNGGGVYADTGSVTLSSAKFTANRADNGNGGGVYGNSGAMTLTSCTFGGASSSGNSAVNGAAVYTETGSATFSTGNVTYNTATNGGAVGVGSGSARLYFSKDVKVTDNTMSGSASNVYLDQDSDAIINAGVGNTGLGNNASIGIYVPDKNVTVTDISGVTSTENLFDRRGVPGAFFATYTNNSNVGRFSNDRLPGLSVQSQTTSKRLYWGKAFTVEVRYLASLSTTSFTTSVADGDLKKVDNNNTITYYAPSSNNTASEIADDLRNAHTISNLSGTAVFGVAFVGDDRTFANYITDVNWDSANNRWSFIRRDGTAITGEKLVVYFTEPSYISIENNTEYPLSISGLTVLGQSAINSNTDTGYGYVFAVNGVIQDSLQPITAADLTLQPGKNIKLLFPGGKNAAWVLNGGFNGASGDITYTLNGTANTLASANTGSFTLYGTTLNTNGGTYSIVFGGKPAICKIVTTEIASLSDNEIAGRTNADGDGYVEYTFSTLNQAKEFVVAHMSESKTATIEMLVDYLIPASDVVSLPAGYNFTFTTATTGTYKYSGTSNRATISRDQGNNASFISSVNGTLVSGDYNTSLKVENLIFDGKNFGGSSISGGVVKTKGCNVEINNADFRNCVAKFGGGIYIESVDKNSSNKTPYGSLKVTNTRFIGCQSQETGDKFGGGAIWTSMKNVTIEDSSFTNCQAVAQAGAVFHYVGGNYTTTSTITGCTFEGCQSKAAGSLESGAKTVTITGCTFRDSKATERNGGAVNVYALDSANPAVSTGCSVKLEDCTFENCYCVVGNNGNGNGGALRSTAVNNEVINCSFKNATGVLGGAIAISNSNADKATITNCRMENCTATKQGGSIYCTAKTVTINGDTSSITNCKATNEGGAIYHGRNVNGSSLSIEGLTIDNCSSTGKAGGGIYSIAQTVSLSRVAVKNCTSPAQGGGLCLIPGNSSGSNRSVTVTDSVIQGNEASGNGGGLYYECSNGMLTFTGSTVSGNTSGGMGGGIYTNAPTVTLTGTTVSNNTATGSGGGVCQNYNNQNGRLTVDSCTISGNTSGGQGGGTYTMANMTIRNNTSISGNHLSTDTVTDAAGVYLPNKRILTVGTEGAATDTSRVVGNLTLGGNPSNLRLPQKSEDLTSDNSETSIDVLCHLSGEFRVIDAFSKGTKFGTSEISTAQSPVYTIGFSDVRHVFIADDDSLYGIIDRSDTSLRRIIWAGVPICKITDANGRLLYVDTAHEYPAVFDKLDTANATDTSSVSAFSILRNANPRLYYADGTLYTGSTYQVKMLVENYTANNRINTVTNNGRTIILTTAGSADSQYPYRGRSGTRSTITRGTSGTASNNNFITANVNLTLTNIVLDGGSESGVTASNNTRIISSSTNGVTVTLGRNSALQNAEVSGSSNGGAVYLNNASLVIEGGAIRNCSAANGGAVYKDGANGTVTMTGGSITRCTANVNGGGICINKGPTNADAFTMTGGSITRCTAANGGGVWINNNYRMSMSGGSISQNKATSAGGGVAVGGEDARIFFSGAPFVYGNTCDTSVASTKANNVQMDQGFTVSDNNPGTIIHTSGLIRGATIGVYVPGEDHNDNNGGSLYDAHGAELDPFATYEGTPAGFNYFINDRNGLKGGLMEGQADTDMKIYWRQIYTLEVNLEVLSKAESDKNIDFRFTVTLNGNAGGTSQGTQWNEVNKTYGDLEFHAGVATFTLNGSTKTTTMADLLPLGYGYTVTMDDANTAGFTVYPGFTQTGQMNNPSQFLYTVNFRIVKDVVCKITDETYGLLYYKRGEAYAEAVYDALVSAFNRVNMGELYYKVGDTYIPYASNDHRIEMLVPEYEMTAPTALNAEKTVLLTTADPYADDGFPYAGGSSTAVIKRGYDGASMITANGSLTLGNITLDGGSTAHSATTNGGIVNVASGASLTVGTGATLQNSKTSGSGAAVYLAKRATMNISGNPTFSNNISTGVDLPSGAKNGDETYTQAHQDIYIDEYNNETATSLHVTGDLTGSEGSIWVWAAETPHYKQSKQFAVMDGGPYDGLNVFRNARTDADTDNLLTTDPKYLYGVQRRNDEYVYWSGGADLTVLKTVTGEMGDLTREFTFTITGLPEGQLYSYKKYTTTDGVTWTEVTDGGGTLTSSANSFTLKHHQKIEIEDLPLNTEMTITETDNGYYTTTWDIGSSESTGNSNTIKLTEDSELSVTNYLPAVAPTGYYTNIVPYLLLLLAGTLLLLLRQKRKGGGVRD